MKEFFESAGKQIRKIISPLSTELGKIHSKLSAMLKAHEGFSSQRIRQQGNAATPFLNALKTLNERDYEALRTGLLNP